MSSTAYGFRRAGEGTKREGRRLPRSLMFSVSLLVLAIDAPATAADVDDNSDLRLAQPVQDDGPLRLAPVTVTGEKTERSLQETASSVSVETEEDLNEHPGNATLDATMRGMPNVVGTGTGNFAPTIRGDDATGPANGVFAFLGGTRPRVTIQQDGRPLSFNELVYGRAGLWDVERVEVLRGPQTTLQGRNSIAGAIIVETKDPTYEFEGAARGVIGNSGTRELSGMVSGPIVEDQLAFRLTADQRFHDSWVDVQGDQGVEDIKEDNSFNFRGKLLFEPRALPDLSTKFTFNHVETRRPQTEFVSAPFEDRQLGAAFEFPVFDNRADSGILEVNYLLTPALELRNTASYTDLRVRRLTLPGNGIVDIRGDEASNELVAEYDTADLHSIFGTYFFRGASDETIDIGPGAFEDETLTVAFFGEGTIPLTERLDLTLGARYEREHRERVGNAAVFDINLDETFDAFLPKVGLAYQATEDVTFGATIQRGWNAGGAGISFAPPFPSFTYDEEFVWNYEAFVRTSWLDDRLFLNANVFLANYRDQQRLAFLDPADPASGVIRNAERTRSYGAELTASWLPLRELEITGTLGLLHSEILEFSASNLDLTGAEFARAPNVTASLGALYRHPSGVRLGVDGQFTGGYFSDDANTASDKIGPHFLLNAHAGYEEGNVEIFAFVNNILNRDDELLIFVEDSAQMVDPREFGVGMTVRF